MPRIRMIKPDFFLHEFLGSRPPLARLLFAGLWCHADREGRLQDRPTRLKLQILPYDACNIDELLDMLIDAEEGVIKRYSYNGKKYIQIINFTKHQHCHFNEQDSDIPYEDGNFSEKKKGVRTEKAPDMPSARLGQEPVLPDTCRGTSTSTSTLTSSFTSTSSPNTTSQVVESEEDFIFTQEGQAMVYEDLVLHDMPQIDIDKYFDKVEPYQILRAYNETKEKYDQSIVNSFIGYFKGIIKYSTGYMS